MSLALYVHWPFCVTKCPYCDFNSHVRASVDDAAWRAALLADLAHEAAKLPGGRLASIFFGGGTPSLMPPATVAAVIDAATAHWPAEPDIEITLEANPSSVEAARFAGFAAAGVNRLSLGLQALDDADLKALGRPHDLAQGLAALDIAQANFNRVSFDLIYDRPGMTVDSWQAELARGLSFGTSHLSLYQLTIEAGTRFAALHAKGQLTLPDSDTSADLFELTQAMTEAAGLPAYEVSNHARAGAESRHNLAYWTYGDYAGIGPGAHGRRGGMATERLVFKSLADLLFVPGFTRTVMQQIADKVAVDDKPYRDNVVNVNTAPAEVLALVPGMDHATLQAILNYRQGGQSFQTIGDIFTLQDVQLTQFQAVLANLSAKSSLYKVRVRVRSANSAALYAATALVEVTDNGPIIRQWREVPRTPGWSSWTPWPTLPTPTGTPSATSAGP